MATQKLTLDLILTTAVEAIEQGGVGKFSMRKLAGEMGVDPMALYHHFRNKDAVLHGVLEHTMQDLPADLQSGDWKKDIRFIGDQMRHFARQHPQLFRLYKEQHPWPEAKHRLIQSLYKIVRTRDMDEQAAARSVRLIYQYFEGFCFDEMFGDQGLDDQVVGSLQTEITLVPFQPKYDANAEFEFGLKVLLDGLEAGSRKEAD